MSHEELKSRSPEQLREEIERTRAQISDSMVDLRRDVARTADWREWVRQKPGWVLTGAFAVGLLLGRRRRN